MRNELLRKRKEARHLWKANARLRKRELRLERLVNEALEKAMDSRKELLENVSAGAMEVMMENVKAPSPAFEYLKIFEGKHEVEEQAQVDGSDKEDHPKARSGEDGREDD